MVPLLAQHFFSPSSRLIISLFHTRVCTQQTDERRLVQTFRLLLHFVISLFFICQLCPSAPVNHF